MHLSETDKKILLELSKGKTIKEVARIVLKSSATINQRLTRLREQADCKNTTQLLFHFREQIVEKKPATGGF